MGILLTSTSKILPDAHRRGEPAQHLFRDVIYMPRAPTLTDWDKNWGLYDREGALLRPAATFRAGNLVGQSERLEIDIKRVREEAPDDVYIYAGHFGGHFGHFITETLPRFWSTRYAANPNVKFLLHSQHTVDELFALPFVAFLLERLGLTKQNFIRFSSPVRIRKLIVPEPCFEESGYAYEAFAWLCNRIGDDAVTGLPMPKSAPVYLTKARLTHGVTRLVNEDELTARLESRGIEVVSPELLDLSDQINLFRGGRVVAGFVGSAFHGSIFTPRATGVALSYNNDVSTNFLLCDAVNASRVGYFFPRGISSEAGSGHFHTCYRLEQPQEVADALLVKIDIAQKNRERALRWF